MRWRSKAARIAQLVSRIKDLASNAIPDILNRQLFARAHMLKVLVFV